MNTASSPTPVFSKKPRLDRRGNLVQQVHQFLLEGIISVTLKPGQVLREREISEELMVSRTPIREALLKLADDGLVDIFPQTGTYVSRISVEEVHESQFIREALETAMVRYATENGTKEWFSRLEGLLEQYRQAIAWNDLDELFGLDELFHRTIADYRFTRRLWSFTNKAKAHMDRVRRLSLPIPERRQEILQEHERVLKAMVQGDVAEAVASMCEHLSTVFSDLERVRKEYPDYFTE